MYQGLNVLELLILDVQFINISLQVEPVLTNTIWYQVQVVTVAEVASNTFESLYILNSIWFEGLIRQINQYQSITDGDILKLENITLYAPTDVNFTQADIVKLPVKLQVSFHNSALLVVPLNIQAFHIIPVQYVTDVPVQLLLHTESFRFDSNL